MPPNHGNPAGHIVRLAQVKLEPNTDYKFIVEAKSDKGTKIKDVYQWSNGGSYAGEGNLYSTSVESHFNSGGYTTTIPHIVFNGDDVIFTVKLFKVNY